MKHHQQDGYSLNNQRATSRYRWLNIFHDSVDFVVEEYAAAVVNHARMHEPCLQHSQYCSQVKIEKALDFLGKTLCGDSSQHAVCIFPVSG